jgi:hypothetical protein
MVDFLGPTIIIANMSAESQFVHLEHREQRSPI